MSTCYAAVFLATILGTWLPATTALASPSLPHREELDPALLDPLWHKAGPPRHQADPIWHQAEAEEVPPAILENLRGRFVDANQILFFGIEMHTRWESAQQDTQAVQLNLNVDMSSTGQQSSRPTANLTITSAGNSKNPQADTAAPPLARTGIETTGGVQIIQIQGNGNRVINAIQIDLRESDPRSDPSTASVASIPLTQSGQLSMTNESGTVTRVDVTPDRFGYSISTPQHGEIVQSLQSSGLIQSTRIRSDHNVIENHLRLQIHQAQNRQMPSEGPHRAMELLQGIPDMGRF